MRSFIESISTNTWEVAGSLVGLAACGFIALQLYHEWLTDTPSSLSWFHLIGILLVLSLSICSGFSMGYGSGISEFGYQTRWLWFYNVYSSFM